MRRLLLSALVVLATAATAAVGVSPVSPATADPGDPAALEIGVTGTDAATYPAWDPAITRYAITTTDATAGAVTVDVTLPEGASARVDGQPAPGGHRTLTGLAGGDEISVLVTDAGATTAYSLVYLPATFPTLTATTPTDGQTPSPGATLLTLARYVEPSRFFLTAVDEHGVPLMVRDLPNANDFKRLPGGGYSVATATGTSVGGHYDVDIVELDPAFREVRRTRAKDLADTDFHDFQVAADGTRYYVSYEDDADTGLVDAVIQGRAPDGTVTFQWDSKAVVGESVLATDDPMHPDYAHINSIELADDGNLIASFRHLSSVFKIATHDQPGYDQGDVMWKLGGRDSTFTTMLDEHGDPDGGPCAQHSVRELANGDLLMFDNGSTTFVPPLFCLAPGDPGGDAVQRPWTRIVQWHLDPDTHTATIVWNYRIPGGLAVFAGSAQRLADGNTFIGHASAAQTSRVVASEVDPDQDVVWQLSTPSSVGTPWFSYRAQKALVPDAQKPAVAISVPAVGAAYPQGRPVTPVASCTDQGGSTLQTCTVPPTIDTTRPGTHTYTVTATDGAGNTTTAVRSYRVLAPGRPDAAVRAAGGSYAGVGRYGWTGTSRVALRLPRAGAQRGAYVRITNRGDQPARFTLTRSAGTRGFRAYLTAPGGVGRSPLLAPGASWTVKVRVVRTKAAPRGGQRSFLFRVRSTTDASLRDSVMVRALARR